MQRDMALIIFSECIIKEFIALPIYSYHSSMAYQCDATWILTLLLAPLKIYAFHLHLWILLHLLQPSWLKINLCLPNPLIVFLVAFTSVTMCFFYLLIFSFHGRHSQKNAPVSSSFAKTIKVICWLSNSLSTKIITIFCEHSSFLSA